MRSLLCNLEASHLSYKMSKSETCPWKAWPHIFGRCLRSEKASPWKNKAGGGRLQAALALGMLSLYPLVLKTSMARLEIAWFLAWPFHINRSFGRCAAEKEGTTPGQRERPALCASHNHSSKGSECRSLMIWVWHSCMSLFEDDVSSC